MHGDDTKLKNLDSRIKEAKSSIKQSNNQNIKPSPIGKVLKLAVEIVAAMAIGVAIGLFLDSYCLLYTSPSPRDRG